VSLLPKQEMKSQNKLESVKAQFDAVIIAEDTTENTTYHIQRDIGGSRGIITQKAVPKLMLIMHMTKAGHW
jgi:hypothetical protein